MMVSLGILLFGTALFVTCRRVAPRLAAFRPKGKPENTSRWLSKAGLNPNRRSQFERTRVGYALLGLAFGLLFLWFGASPLLTPVMAGLGWFWPAMRLQKSIRRRQRAIELALPYYLDLLTLAIEAGLDLVAAIEEIVSRDSPNPLREELLFTLKAIRMGERRSIAFEKMAERTGLEALSIWAASIRNSEELGSSLGDLLRLQAESLRKDIFRDAEERAQRAPLKMLIPLIGLIFPVVFLLLFFPIAVRLLGGM